MVTPTMVSSSKGHTEMNTPTRLLLTTILWGALLLLTVIVVLSSPFLVFFIIPFFRKDPVNVLPSWLQWFNTPDDTGCNQGTHLPGDPTGTQYEQQVVDFGTRWGWRAKTWYWLGVRNQMYGLFKSIGATPPSSWTVHIRSTIPTYPRNNPYTPGAWLGWTTIGAVTYFEFTAVWGWTATKFGMFRMGWKIQTVMPPNPPGSLMFLLQLKPWLTK